MAVPDALLHSLEGQDGGKTAEGKENAYNVIKANSLQASQSCLKCPSHECCPVQSLARWTVTNCKQEPNQRFEGISQLLLTAVMYLDVVHAVQSHHLVLLTFTHCRSLPARTT